MSKTKKLTEIAVAVALATVCSFIRVWQMPQGGSIALTMVPIFLIAIKRGPFAGFLTGGIYGVISLLIDGVIYHPLSVLLDYVLAFGILGIAGLFKKTVWGVILGCAAGCGGRFLCSVISGAVIFASYAPVGQNPWVYSLIYQATYMIPESIIAAAVLVILFLKTPKLFENKK